MFEDPEESWKFQKIPWNPKKTSERLFENIVLGFWILGFGNIEILDFQDFRILIPILA